MKISKLSLILAFVSTMGGTSCGEAEIRYPLTITQDNRFHSTLERAKLVRELAQKIIVEDDLDGLLDHENYYRRDPNSQVVSASMVVGDYKYRVMVYNVDERDPMGWRDFLEIRESPVGSEEYKTLNDGGLDGRINEGISGEKIYRDKVNNIPERQIILDHHTIFQKEYTLSLIDLCKFYGLDDSVFRYNLW